MRVPTLDGPQLDARAPASPAPSLLSGSPAVGNAIRQVGAGLQQAAGQIDASIQKAQREAEAVIGADADLELDARNEAVKSEAFKQKGLSASEGRAKVVEQLAKNRQEVASGIKSQAERNRFLVRSSAAVIASRRQVESHVGREFEAAREGATKAIEDSAINKAESGGLDPAEFSLVEVNAIRTIRETQRSEEEGSARIADFQSRVSAAFTAGLIAQGRSDEAVKYVEASRQTLGGRYVEAKGLVDRANAGAEKDRLIAEGAKLVDGSYESLRQEGNEYVSGEQLRGAVRLDETEPGVRGEVEQALERRVRQEAARFRADVGTHRDNVSRGDLTGKKDKQFGESLIFLEKHDPDFLLARDARRRAEARAWKASQTGDARTKAAEAKAQRELDLQFRYRLEHALIDDPATKPDEVLTAFIAERAKEGDDVTVSATEQERAGATAAKRVKESGTAIEASRTKFTNEFGAVLRAKMKPSGKGAKVDDELLQQRKGNAASEYSNWVEANGGKPLDATAAAELKARLLKDAVIDPGTSFGPFTFGEKKGLAVDQVKKRSPVPTSAQPPGGFITIRRKSDGRTRSVSAAEAKRFLSSDDFEQVP